MILSDSVVRVLDRYKYSNVSLEKTMSELAVALGYVSYKATYSGEYAEDLCKYKWNRITKLALVNKVLDASYLQNVPGGLSMDWSLGNGLTLTWK